MALQLRKARRIKVPQDEFAEAEAGSESCVFSAELRHRQARGSHSSKAHFLQLPRGFNPVRRFGYQASAV